MKVAIAVLFVLLGVFTASSQAASSSCAEEIAVGGAVAGSQCYTPCCLCQLVMKASGTTISPSTQLSHKLAAITRYLVRVQADTTEDTSCYDPCSVCYTANTISTKTVASQPVREKTIIIEPQPVVSEPVNEEIPFFKI